MPGLGRVHIDDARQVQWADLTDADAQADGFENLQTLRLAIDELYPPQDRKGRNLYQIHFTLLTDQTDRPAG